MEGGLFLLLCVIALIIGSKARSSSSKTLSNKELKRKERIKSIMIWSALVLISMILLAYIPFLIQEIRIAIDTHFELETYLSMVLFLLGMFTIYTIITSLKRQKVS
jgi:hypothetical protein